MTNAELIMILDKRVELEKLNEVEMLELLGEVIDRKVWIEFGATSVFDFMTNAHYHYAPVVAQRKVDGAKLLLKFPFLKDYMLAGEINLTQLGMMATALRKKRRPNLPRSKLSKACAARPLKIRRSS